MDKKHSSGNASDLIESVSTGDHATFFRLINEGANIYALDADGHSLRWHAEQKHDQTILDSLALLESVNGRKMEDKSSNTSCIQKQEEEDFYDNSKREKNAEQVEIVKKIVVRNDEEYEKKQFLLKLLRHGKVYGVDKEGNNALILATDLGIHALIPFLIDEGADVNRQNGEGETPLYHAAKRGNVELVQLLLERGADPNIKTKAGRKPVKIASIMGNMAIEKLLKSHKAGKKTKKIPWLAVSLVMLGLAIFKIGIVPHFKPSPQDIRIASLSSEKSVTELLEKENRNNLSARDSFYLCRMYGFGYGVKLDTGKSRMLLNQAASEGDCLAQYELGCQMMLVEEKEEAGKVWMKKALNGAEEEARKGNMDAILAVIGIQNLGEVKSSFSGEQLNKMGKQALNEMSRSTDPVDQFVFLIGQETAPADKRMISEEESMRRLQNLANENLVVAQKFLGELLLEDGKAEAAKEWLLKAYRGGAVELAPTLESQYGIKE